MRRVFLLISGLFLILSCDRYPDPSTTLMKDYSFAFQDVQSNKFFQGDWVGDSIIFRAYNNRAQAPDSIRVDFDLVSGGGSITVQSAYTNKQGEVYLRWKLGTGSFEQKLRARTFDSSGEYLSSAYLFIYAFKNDGWDPYTNDPDGGMTGMVADTVNKVTYMISGGKVYKQGQEYFNWNQITDPVLSSARTINIDRNGVIYISTWTGDLVKSTDHGLSWIVCKKPYPDRPYYIYVYVSNDNYVWVFAWDNKIRYSGDGGTIWTDIDPLSGITAEGFGDIFRLKDGSLLYHGSNCCNMNRSFDNGKTWIKINTPGYSNKMYVNDKDEIFICTQEGGITIYKSVDYGLNFTRIYSVYPQWGTSMENTFNKWGDTYYILIPGFGVIKSTDLGNPDAYSIFYSNSDLFNLFIDQNGVLIAITLNKHIVYYYKKSEK
jgi:hypothetical protein